MIDIHCHLLPEMDDGAASWEASLAMARIAAADGIQTVICTPHQLGSYRGNTGDLIRSRVQQLQQGLRSAGVDLHVVAGGDVRIEADMISLIQSGHVLTLADRRQYILLELPHECYFPLLPVLQQLRAIGITGILSHPERNQGLLSEPELLGPLVDAGCLMQVTAGSLLGAFGAASQRLAELMLRDGLVHFLATDAHGTQSRRPRLSAARRRVTELTTPDNALDLCVRFPQMVLDGTPIPSGRRTIPRGHKFRNWFGRARSA